MSAHLDISAGRYCHKGIGPGSEAEDTGRGQRVGARTLRVVSDLSQPRLQDRRRGNIVFDDWHIWEM